MAFCLHLNFDLLWLKCLFHRQIWKLERLIWFFFRMILIRPFLWAIPFFKWCIWCLVFNCSYVNEYFPFFLCLTKRPREKCYYKWKKKQNFNKIMNSNDNENKNASHIDGWGLHHIRSDPIQSKLRCTATKKNTHSKLITCHLLSK